MRVFKLVFAVLLLLPFISCVDSEQAGRLVWTETADNYPVWKGERKSFSAEFETEVDLKGLRVEVSDLKSSSSVIEASAISSNFLAEVMADVLDTTRFGQCGQRPAGKYDSLYVAAVLDIVETKDVLAGDKHPIWFTVSVPADAEPGNYTGEVILKAKGGYRWSLPVELEVIDRLLPEPKEWKFHLDLWQNPYSVARYHGVELWSQEHFDYMRPVMEMLANAGQKVVTATILDRPWDGQTEDAFGSMVKKVKYADGHWEYDFSIFDKWVEFMFSIGIDKQINCYSMIPWKLTFDYIDGESGETKYINAAPGDAEYAFYWDNFIRAFAKHLKEKGWFEKTMIAMDERPMEDMLAAMDVIKSADPDFKVSLAGKYHPELAYSLDDYCIASLRFPVPEEVIVKRTEMGLITTWYTCCAEAKPNLFVVSEPQEAVWLGWYALADGYDGYLRWAYNSWVKEPLKDTRFRTWPAGDCFVVYPEGRSSIQFEKLIEGIQDYEKAKIMMAEWEASGNEEAIQQLQDALELFTLPELLENGASAAIHEAKMVLCR